VLLAHDADQGESKGCHNGQKSDAAQNPKHGLKLDEQFQSRVNLVFGMDFHYETKQGQQACA